MESREVSMQGIERTQLFMDRGAWRGYYADRWQVLMCNWPFEFNPHLYSSFICCREAKHHAGPKYLRSSIMEFGGITSAKCNANGSKISVIVSKVC